MPKTQEIKTGLDLSDSIEPDKRQMSGNDQLVADTISFFEENKYINPLTLEPNFLVTSAFKIIGEESFTTDLSYEKLCAKIIAGLIRSRHRISDSSASSFIELLAENTPDDEFLDLAGSIIAKLSLEANPELERIDNKRYEEWDL